MNNNQKILIAIVAIAVLGAPDNAEGLDRARRLAAGRAAKPVAAQVEQASVQPAQVRGARSLLDWGAPTALNQNLIQRRGSDGYTVADQHCELKEFYSAVPCVTAVHSYDAISSHAGSIFVARYVNRTIADRLKTAVFGAISAFDPRNAFSVLVCRASNLFSRARRGCSNATLLFRPQYEYLPNYLENRRLDSCYNVDANAHILANNTPARLVRNLSGRKYQIHTTREMPGGTLSGNTGDLGIHNDNTSRIVIYGTHWKEGPITEDTRVGVIFLLSDADATQLGNLIQRGTITTSDALFQQISVFFPNIQGVDLFSPNGILHPLM